MPWKPITTAAQLQGQLERSSFDFKREYNLRDPGVAAEMAKDVAAFASGYGGTVLIGVDHVDGRVTELIGVAEPQRVIEALRRAVAAYCVPWPRYSEDSFPITAVDAQAILGASLPASFEPMTVLAINVEPESRGPIGVRPDGPKGTPIAQAYRFPVRVGDATEWPGPLELPMWMNSHERRVAIHLRQIPSHTLLRAFHYPFGTQGAIFLDVYFEAVDEARGVAVFSSPTKRQARVPLSFVSAAWQDPSSSDVWCVHLEGTLFPGNVHVGFQPRNS